VLKFTYDNISEIGRGHSRGGGGRGRGRGRERQSLNKELIECFWCHKLGHFQYQCPRVEKQAHYAMYENSSEIEEEILLVAYEATNVFV